MKHRLRILALVASVAMLACEHETFPTANDATPTVTPQSFDAKVVVFVIDGPRYQDSFGDPLHTYIPGIWNQLRPQGTFCSDYRNIGWTNTVPGHGSMLTGVWQFLADDGSERVTKPTLFEYYRKQKGTPAADAVLVGGKPKLLACAYSLDAAYGAAFGATTDLENPTDLDSYGALIEHLQTDHPHLVMVAMSQVDQKGHTGDWNVYTRQLEIVDSLAVQTWNYLQSDPVYANQTYLFITADHGRHDDAHGGFQNHGDSCPGCQHVIFLALGPNIRQNYEVTTTLYTQRDLCNTVGRVLGIDTPQSDGFPINELFVPTSTGISD